MVGAGPAGSTTARYAARRGLSVFVIDRRRVIGVPVQCGEYVAHNSEVEGMVPGVTGLDELMSAPYRSRQIDTDALRIVSPRGRAFEVPFSGFTVNRAAMDQAIAAQAVEAGAEVRTNITALDVRGTSVVTTRGVFEGKVIAGCDGPLSRVARSVGLDWPVSAPAMSATLGGKFSTITNLYFGDVAPGGYAWVIPKGESANIGVGVWPRYRGRLNVFFEAFLRKLRLPVVHGTGGYVPLEGPVPQTVKGNVILVGDAAGHVMPTNGGGINTSMICGRIAGEIVAEHVTTGVPLGEYERRWRGLVGDVLERGRKTRRLADYFFGNERRLEAAMRFLGPKRMGRAIRCQRLFFAR